jgi:hypothetical protein
MQHGTVQCTTVVLLNGHDLCWNLEKCQLDPNVKALIDFCFEKAEVK